VLHDHPHAERFLTAHRDGGWQVGDVLPFHHADCWGCGPDNRDGFELRATVEEGDAVRAEVTFDGRYRGAPGLVHGGAIAGIIDDLFGYVLMRVLVPAVTAELSVSYRRPLHLDEPCVLRAEVVGRTDRDLDLLATIEQHERCKVEARARFRVIEPERMMNRYEPLERG
jgi:acyl-coenzyme A thioesterase PaaI-like protein